MDTQCFYKNWDTGWSELHKGKGSDIISMTILSFFFKKYLLIEIYYMQGMIQLKEILAVFRRL